MAVKLLPLKNDLVKKYVQNAYVFERDDNEIIYTSYPSPIVAIALLRDADVNVRGDFITVAPSSEKNHFAIACNRLDRPISFHYKPLRDEIAINFTHIGFAAFARSGYKNGSCFKFHTWDDKLAPLLDAVFATTDFNERTDILEKFLQEQFTPVPDEAIITTAIDMLCAFNQNYSLQQIADKTGLHYKDLYRRFTKLTGSSPAHYRKIARFRQAVYAKMSNADIARLTDLCYRYNFSDQAYFVKQFRELTGEKPGTFFKGLTRFDNILWKFD